eukprot:4892934-Pleurochrysis_carterae.AAC.2
MNYTYLRCCSGRPAQIEAQRSAVQRSAVQRAGGHRGSRVRGNGGSAARYVLSALSRTCSNEMF